jgi:hypothetical protein
MARSVGEEGLERNAGAADAAHATAARALTLGKRPGYSLVALERYERK